MGLFLGVAQVARLLGCSTAAIYHRCERGDLPHFRDGRNALRFDCRRLGRALGLHRRRMQ
jgi:hypothetical protein